ncbi:hypothetical protein SESBI_45521 [Sesbania bispinosa]|nr:hypothetical protein SESBI_45521 [Sesbania bispinosa]
MASVLNLHYQLTISRKSIGRKIDLRKGIGFELTLLTYQLKKEHWYEDQPNKGHRF